MTFTLHQLLGNSYPVYYCETCKRSFLHPADQHPESCPTCSGWFSGPLPCEHEGHELIT